MASTWSYLDLTVLGRQEEWVAAGLPADPTLPVVGLPRRVRPGSVVHTARTPGQQIDDQKFHCLPRGS